VRRSCQKLCWTASSGCAGPSHCHWVNKPTDPPLELGGHPSVFSFLCAWGKLVRVENARALADMQITVDNSETLPENDNLCTCRLPTKANIFWILRRTSHENCAPCHRGMARLQVTDGGVGLPILKVAANILNKQLRRADKGWSSSLGLVVGLTSHSKKISLLRSVTKDLGLGWILWINHLS
jgi:hypothetical protein